MSKHGQATSTWLEAHPEMWKGEDGQARAVAGIAIEHLGALGDTENTSIGSYSLETTRNRNCSTRRVGKYTTSLHRCGATSGQAIAESWRQDRSFISVRVNRCSSGRYRRSPW
ncbi:hypothetical protein ACETU7_34125 [Rhodococcus sp. 3Y1]